MTTTNEAKKWYQSKLIWVGAGEIIAGAVSAYNGDVDGQSLMLLISGVLTSLFRAVTSKKLKF